MKLLPILIPIVTVAILIAIFTHGNLKNKRMATAPASQENASVALTKGNSDAELEMDASQTDKDLDQIVADTDQFSQSLNEAAQDNESNIKE